MTDRPTRRDLMKPVQLIGLAFAAAAFAGVVTLVSMGFFQGGSAEQMQNAVVLALVVGGISFIAVLLIMALLLLAVDPAQVAKTIDRPVLLPDEKTGEGETDAGSAGTRSP
ncbi:amino acid transporter [Microbacterium aureliae]